MRNANVRHRQEIENLMKEAPQDQIAELEELHNQTTELEARLQEL
jgi:hypothetical protein